MSAPEPDSTIAHSEGSGFAFTVVTLSFLVLLYPLSVGPVAKHYQTREAPQAIGTIYAPLKTLYDKLPPVHAFFDWYFGLWGIK